MKRLFPPLLISLMVVTLPVWGQQLPSELRVITYNLRAAEATANPTKERATSDFLSSVRQ